jgi:hypothetical protein
VRRAVIRRETRETSIAVTLAIEGRGRYDVSTGIRFLDHMLELVIRHGAFDMKVKAAGDLDVTGAVVDAYFPRAVPAHVTPVTVCADRLDLLETLTGGPHGPALRPIPTAPARP